MLVVAVWQEAVRGGFCAGIVQLPGLERVRALMAPEAVQPPLFRFTGIRVAQAGPGSATCSVPATTLLLDPLQWVDLLMLAEATATMAATTGVSPGGDVRCAAISLHHQRAARLDAERLIARASTVHAGRTYSLVDVSVEDAVGRPVARAMASLVGTNAVDDDQLDVAEPAWPSPDPWKREFRPRPIVEAFEAYNNPPPADADYDSLLAPLHAQLGFRPIETTPGRHTASLPTTRWLTDRGDRIAAGVVVGLTGWTMGGANATLMSPDHRIAVIEHHAQLLRAIGPADGPLVCQARVTHDVDEFHVTAAEVTDTHGHVVATAGFTSIAAPLNAGVMAPAERLLTTVLFSDVVGSTAQAGQLGDEAWRYRLATHRAMVRRQLDAFRGREIKTMGDGFLALFDVPARAVQCAKAIRAGLRAEGMEVTIGLHTGECDLSAGDVSGVAVHAAARIEAAAGPGEVLVSRTVRDLTAGAGLLYEERGEHVLKGFEGTWQLFAVPE